MHVVIKMNLCCREATWYGDYVPLIQGEGEEKASHVSDQWSEETHTQLQCRSIQHPTLWHQHWPGRSAGQGELSRPVKHPISKLKSPWRTWTLSAVLITKSNAVLNCIQLPFAGVRGLWQMGCGYFQNIWVFWQPSPNGSDVHNLPGIKCGIKNFSHVVSVKALQ